MTHFTDVTLKGKLLSKNQLDHKAGKQIAGFENYKLIHFFNSQWASFCTNKELTFFKSLMLADSLPPKDLISKIYSTILQLIKPQMFNFQNTWQKDLKLTIDERQWDSLWKSSLHASRSMNVQMLTYKIAYRWHITLHKLHRMYPSVLNNCWKGCRDLGTYIHCFWLCPRVKAFREQILHQIHLITGIQLPAKPELTILNLWADFQIDLLTRCWAAAEHLPRPPTPPCTWDQRTEPGELEPEPGETETELGEPEMAGMPADGPKPTRTRPHTPGPAPSETGRTSPTRGRGAAAWPQQR